MTIDRRRFLKGLGIAASAPYLGCISACASAPVRGAPHVVVVGGGYGGATAAKYLRMWSEGRVRVTLVEREAGFLSCPGSNLVIAGLRGMGDITGDYHALQRRWGVRVLTGEATGIDPATRTLHLADGERLDFDRLIVSPGVDFLTGEIEGLAGQTDRIPHAWKAGPQTTLLRRQLESMADGGVFALHIPTAPYRCPPGPYERACVVAHYLRTHKPRAKLLVLDANSEIQSKKALFTAAFDGPYRNLVEYRPNSTLVAVRADTLRAELEFDTLRADVLNVIPPMRAGRLADRLGVGLVNGRWVDVDWLTMEARGAPGIHVIGDAVMAAPGMPKSGHIANQQAKLAAAAIIELLAGRAPDPAPMLSNTCYSFVDDRRAVHVTSTYRHDAGESTFVPVAGAGGLSAAPGEAEGRYADAWARSIRADMLA